MGFWVCEGEWELERERESWDFGSLKWMREIERYSVFGKNEEPKKKKKLKEDLRRDENLEGL